MPHDGKWCSTGYKLVSFTNRKSHTGFWLVRKSVTLNDLERRNDRRRDARYLCGSWSSCFTCTVAVIIRNDLGARVYLFAFQAGIHLDTLQHVRTSLCCGQTVAVRLGCLMKNAVHLYKHVADAAIKQRSGSVKVWNDWEVSGTAVNTWLLMIDVWPVCHAAARCTRHLIADQLMGKRNTP